MDQPGVGVEGEDDRFVRGEQGVEFRIAQAVRMLGLRLQLHEIDNIDHPDLEVGQVLPQDGNGSERLERGHIPGASHDHVWLQVEFVTGPLTCWQAVSNRRIGQIRDAFFFDVIESE
jgi:hypothetical protein